MFFVLLFLILSAVTAHLFPEWSWVTVLLCALGAVVTLRLLLAATARHKAD